MLEKTFINQTLDRADMSGLSSDRRAKLSAQYLGEERANMVKYIALMLGVKRNDVKISEGTDIWNYHQGRYEGEAEVHGRRIRFVSQNYYKSLAEKYVRVSLKNLNKVNNSV